ncbi:MAG TPA: TRAP transporter small permease [Saliniramus sp.]|nr:TRAP transporter small permease [Saliniramus sp.]
MLRSILDLVDLCALWLARIAALFMAAIAFLMLSEIFARFLFNHSLGVTWELATYAMAAVISLAAADTLRNAGHVRVALLLETLPKRLARLIDILATILALLIIGFLLMAFADFVWNMFQRGTRSFEPSRIMLWIPQSFALFGIVMLFLQLLARLVRLTVMGDADLPSEHEEVSR